MKLIPLVLFISQICSIYIIPNENNKNRPHQHHHHHQPKVKNTKVLSKKFSKQAKINANASAFSKGNGKSMASAGPNGSNSMAFGELGTGTTSNFANQSSTVMDSFGFMNDAFGNSKKFGKKSSENKVIHGASKGGSKGKGSSKTSSNMMGSMSFGQGLEGSMSESNFGNNSDSFGDSWDTQQRANGEYVNKRKKWAKKDHSKTEGRGMSHGKGSAMTKASNTGAMVKASGTKGSKAQSKHQGASDAWGMNFSDSFMGGKKSVKSDKWTKKEQSQGGTEGEAFGNGNVMGMTDRFGGSKGMATGELGTKNNASWKGHSDAKKDSFSTDLDFGRDYKHGHHHRPHYQQNPRPHYHEQSRPHNHHEKSRTHNHHEKSRPHNHHHEQRPPNHHHEQRPHNHGPREDQMSGNEPVPKHHHHNHHVGNTYK